MDHQQISQLSFRHRPSAPLAFSALPGAPVVAHVERGVAIDRARLSAASLLHRLGDRMAPAARSAAWRPGV